MGAPETQFQPLQLTVALDEARQQHLASAQAVVADAEALVVDSGPMAAYANDMLRDVKQRKGRIEAMHEDIVGPIRLALANARKWFTPAIEANEKAEKIIKGKLGAYTLAEQERVATAKRARDEAERHAREQAERDAAAARARAEAAAAEARRKAAEAAEKERLALAAGNTRAAAAAAAERAKREEEERQKLAEGERRAAALQLAAAASAQNVEPLKPAEKVDGFSLRDSWTAELAPGKTEDEAKLEIAKVITAGRTDLLALLKLDMTAAGKLAKAQKKMMSVPGLQAVNKPVSVSRAA